MTPNRCLRIFRLPVNQRSLAGWVIKLEFDHPPEILSAAAGATARVQSDNCKDDK